MASLVDRKTAELWFKEAGLQLPKGKLREFQLDYLAADGEDSDGMSVDEFEDFLREFARKHNKVKL